jgi:integrase
VTPITGVEVRHARTCRSLEGRRCNCDPSYRAVAFDRRSGKRIRKTFSSLAAARAWRSDAQREIRQGARRGPTGLTLRAAAQEWMAGAKRGTVRARGGAAFKPSTLSGYETALAQRILPDLGSVRLEDITKGDVQALADRLLVQGLEPSTIRNALMPLRAIYRHLLAREVVAINPTTGIEVPTSAARRDRIATPQEAADLLAALSGSSGIQVGS